jgi:hypothetical protein
MHVLDNVIAKTTHDRLAVVVCKELALVVLTAKD